jgi:hypothetical protein
MWNLVEFMIGAIPPKVKQRRKSAYRENQAQLRLFKYPFVTFQHWVIESQDSLRSESLTYKLIERYGSIEKV